jgi:hypothetical protein
MSSAFYSAREALLTKMANTDASSETSFVEQLKKVFEKDETKQILRNAAIGSGIGGVLGAVSDSGSRRGKGGDFEDASVSDRLQRIIAAGALGALAGGAGTAGFQALANVSPFAPEIASPVQPLPHRVVGSVIDPALGSPLTAAGLGLGAYGGARGRLPFISAPTAVSNTEVLTSLRGIPGANTPNVQSVITELENRVQNKPRLSLTRRVTDYPRLLGDYARDRWNWQFTNTPNGPRSVNELRRQAASIGGVNIPGITRRSLYAITPAAAGWYLQNVASGR